MPKGGEQVIFQQFVAMNLSSMVDFFHPAFKFSFTRRPDVALAKRLRADPALAPDDAGVAPEVLVDAEDEGAVAVQGWIDGLPGVHEVIST